MDKTIVVAGATGNLGEKVCANLVKNGANVKALVRPESDPEKSKILMALGVQVIKVNLDDHHALVQACRGASCVVSILAGLHEVIVMAQSQLLDSAIEAGVSRFIPSDFSIDFTQIPKNENRNFDLRKEFQRYLETKPINATSIFIGAFTYNLSYNTPLLNIQEKTIGYYGNKADWKNDFTTVEDTAAYTAAVALDDQTPRFLRIASFQVSPNDLVDICQKQFGEKFRLVNMGSMEDFSSYNKILRASDPEGEKQLYPMWQQAQYIYSMFAAHHTNLDNGRYPNLTWSSFEKTMKHQS